MAEALYVATDEHGVEHAASGDISWLLPTDDGPQQTEGAQPLVLRTPLALLDVLDECILRAEATGDVTVAADGTATVPTARLVEPTPWGTDVATRFAFLCAGHVLGDRAGIAVPGGMTLGQIVEHGLHLLDELDGESSEHLGRLARFSELWRLHRERETLDEITLGLMSEDDAKDIEALDDPAYATVAPLVDAVIAAVGALMHHSLPRLPEAFEEHSEEREQHESLDGKDQLRIAHPYPTPIGTFSVGAGHVGRFEPGWTGAREAARHARSAARDHAIEDAGSPHSADVGDHAEQEERSWQAAQLGELLSPA